jgi:hypothetical protein
MDVLLSEHLIDLQRFVNTEGQRVTGPIIASNIPESLHPHQQTVQDFINSILPMLCERLFEEHQARSGIGAVASLPQASTSLTTIDSGFSSLPDQPQNENMAPAEPDLVRQFPPDNITHAHEQSTAGGHPTTVGEGIGDQQILSNEAGIQFQQAMQSFTDDNMDFNIDFSDVLQDNFEPMGIENPEDYPDASLIQLMNQGTGSLES